MTRNANLFTRAANLDPKTIHDSGAPELKAYEDVWATGSRRRMSDLRWGGQMGYSPDFTTWVNFHPYVSRNLIPVLIDAPLGMRALPNAEKWIGALRAMVETMAMSITGLQYQLDVSTGEVAFGGAGQMFEAYTNVKETKPEIEMVFQERVGMPVHRFFSMWIRYLMMDPNTKNATINTIEGHHLNDLMADQYSMTMLFIEPDELNRFVNQAWLVTNMFPKTTGTNTAKRDMPNDMELRELSIPFSGIAQYGAGVDDLAQLYMKTVKTVGADPHAREAFRKNVSDYLRGLEEESSYGEHYRHSAEELIPKNRIVKPQNVGAGGGGIAGTGAAGGTAGAGAVANPGAAGLIP